jgi:hypothetical protein
MEKEVENKMQQRRQANEIHKYQCIRKFENFYKKTHTASAMCGKETKLRNWSHLDKHEGSVTKYRLSL